MAWDSIFLGDKERREKLDEAGAEESATDFFGLPLPSSLLGVAAVETREKKLEKYDDIVSCILLVHRRSAMDDYTLAV